MTTTTTTADEVARLLERQRAGDAAAKDELFALLYEDLRRLAGRQFRAERRDHTCGPTALVHDVYLRLAELPVGARDRRGFMNLVGLAMRRALVDSARRRDRRPDRRPDRAPHHGTEGEPDLQRLELALARLDAFDAELAEVVRLRFLAGLPVEEVAALLEVSAPTVKRRWRVARAWLRREMSGG